MKIVVTIPSKPHGKERAGSGRWGRYKPDSDRDFEEKVYIFYKKACLERFGRIHRFEKDIPLKVSVISYYPVPKSDSGKKRIAKLAGLILPTVKPDGDNVLKAVTDSLNRAAWWDDAQIVEWHFLKSYGEEPKIILQIEEVIPGEGF